MPDEIDEESHEDGGTLRRKLEEALERNKALTAEVAKSRVKEVIAEKGYTLVKPEDLEGVALDEIEPKAKELHEQRRSLESEIAKGIFARQGYEGEELDEVVAEYLEGKAPVRKDPNEALTRGIEGVRALSHTDSQPVGKQDISQLHGADAIAHGLEQRAKRK